MDSEEVLQKFYELIVNVEQTPLALQFSAEAFCQLNYVLWINREAQEALSKQYY